VKDAQYLLVEVFGHDLDLRDFGDELLLLVSSLVHLLEGVIAQIPEIALKLSELILVSVIEAKLLILVPDKVDGQHLKRIVLGQLLKESSIELQMDPPADAILEHEVGVNVVHVDLLVCRQFMLQVETVQGEVVYAVLFGFGGLAEGCEELLVFVVAEVCDVVDIEAVLPGFLAVASHIEPAYKLLLQVLRHPLGPVLLHLANFGPVDLTVLHQLVQVLVHSSLAFLPDVEDASGQEGRHNDVDLGVALHVDEVSHEIAELAQSLSLLIA